LVGILALQGDFRKHRQRLKELNVTSCLIRKPKELNSCRQLIIPGGESTTMTKLIGAWKLFDAIIEFGKDRPIWGTCAGMILLSTDVFDSRVKTLGLIDIDVERNAYGRQVDSFITDVKLTFLDDPFRGVFIRAPKMIKHGDDVKALGYVNNEIVMARNQNILISSFHPELSNDLRIHNYFINKFE